jgi:hypothetical protein
MALPGWPRLGGPEGKGPGGVKGGRAPLSGSRAQPKFRYRPPGKRTGDDHRKPRSSRNPPCIDDEDRAQGMIRKDWRA